MTKHTLHVFERDLQALRADVLALAVQVSEELEQAVTALIRGDSAAAQAVVESDRRADVLHAKIDGHTAQILTRQQAMADDLRAILAAGRIAMHFERIGDYAKNTAKRSQRLSRQLDSTLASHFRWMGARIQTMLSRIIAAYREDNAEIANVAWTDDAELDALYAKLFAHLLEEMKNSTTPLADCVQLLFIAKGLERAGDHVTDIAEEVYLKINGTPLQGARPKVDETAALRTQGPKD